MGHHKGHGHKKGGHSKKKKCSSSTNESSGTSTSWSEHKKKIIPVHYKKRCWKKVRCSRFKKDHESCSQNA